MSFLPFFFANWKYIGLAILMSMLFLSRIQLQNVESEIDAIRSQRAVEIAVNTMLVKQVKDRSTQTVQRINNEHKALVEQAEKNAWRNFVKRYGNGTGANGGGSIGVRLPSTSTGASVADSPKGADAASSGIMAFDGGLLSAFARDCALDAARILEWQSWSQSNHLPIEK